MLSLSPKISRLLASQPGPGRRHRGARASLEVQPLEARSLLSHLGSFTGSVPSTETVRPAIAVQRSHHTESMNGHQLRTAASTVLWNTLSPNSAIAVSSQGNGAIPSEAADDFFFTSSTAPAFSLRTIKIDGLFSYRKAKITDVNVQLYQTYPFDSNPSVTPPTVRANGPADSEFALFDSRARTLKFHATNLGHFTVAQTITPGSATQEGAVGPGLTGQLRQIDITLKKPITLQPAANPGIGQLNHFWLAVTVRTSKGSFYWVGGATNPITTGDRQTWIHTNPFDPNWHRVSDVINGNNTNLNGTLKPAFNESFQLLGKVLSHP